MISRTQSRWMLFALCMSLGLPALGQTGEPNDGSPAAASPRKPLVANPKTQNHALVVRTKGNRLHQGTPLNLTHVDAKVMNTKTSIPVHKILGIRFPINPKKKATIALRSGETLQARITLPEIRLATEWGEAILDPNLVRSIVKSKNLLWQRQQSANGPQWFLVDRTKQHRVPTSKIGVTAYVYPLIDQNEFRWIW